MKNNWQTKKIGEICEVVGGGTPSTSNKKYWDGDLCWVTPKDLGRLNGFEISETERKISEEGLKNSSAKLLPTGSVILSSRAPIGYVFINTIEMATNQGCKSFVCGSEIYNKYLYYFLVSNTEYLNSLGSGSTFKEVSGSALKNIIIKFPLLSEQKRITKILDETFEKLEKIKKNVELNLSHSKEIFESCLESIFTKPKGEYEEKTLKEISTILGDGLHGTPRYTTDGEYYFINGNNLDGKIIIKESTKRVSDAEYRKYKKDLNNRTILVSINGTLGNVAFFNNEKVILGKSACYFNLIQGVDKDFIRYILISPYFIKYAHREATGSTIKNVSLKTMRELKINLPTFEIQKSIVKKLDALSEKTKKLEEIYKKKLENIEELKKSILQKAFNGRL